MIKKYLCLSMLLVSQSIFAEAGNLNNITCPNVNEIKLVKAITISGHRFTKYVVKNAVGEWSYILKSNNPPNSESLLFKEATATEWNNQLDTDFQVSAKQQFFCSYVNKDNAREMINLKLVSTKDHILLNPAYWIAHQPEVRRGLYVHFYQCNVDKALCTFSIY